MMRSTNNYSDKVALFVGDVEDGIIVESQDGELFIPDSETMDEPRYLKDGSELFYPAWASW